MRLRGPRARAVLAMLLVADGQALSIDRLATAWGDDPPASVRNQVMIAVAVLRRGLREAGADPGIIATEGSGYRLRAPATDAAVAESKITEGRRAAEEGREAEASTLFGQALALWRGPVLTDLETEDVRAAAARWEEMRLAVAEERAELELRLGRHSELAAELQALLAEHPLRERLRGLLMLALYRSGRRAGALEVYRTGRRLLVDELGLEPGPELRRLEAAILADDPELLRPPSRPARQPGARAMLVPAELPAGTNGFVGRDGELAALAEFLTAKTAPQVVAIAGTAGVGKTTLAVHFAHRNATAFPDGQLYVNLRGHSPGPAMKPVEALTRMLGSLGVPAEQIPQDEEAAAGLYRSCLAGRRVLVLLDNALTAEQVRPLLPAAPGCLALVTSRSRLAKLIASHGARQLRLHVLGHADALALLASAIGHDRVANEPQAAAELVRLCAHLPLALGVAAANIAVNPHLSIAGYAAALAADRLDTLEIDGESAVRAAFGLSYARLTPDAQRLFRLLGLAPGPDITAEAAAALAGSGTVQAARLLDRLAAAHLIDEPRPRRYAFHDLMRRHAASQAEQDDAPADRLAAIERLGAWYVSAATQVARVAYPSRTWVPTISPPPPAPVPEPVNPPGASGPERVNPPAVAVPAPASPTDALAWLDAERANLVAVAAHAAVEGPRRFAWQIAEILRPYFVFGAEPTDAEALAEAAMRAAVAEDEPLGQVTAQLSLAMNSRLRARYADAAAAFEAAAALARRAGWPQGAAAARNNLAVVLVERGALREARESLRSSHDIYRSAGQLRSQAVIAGNLGVVCLQLGALDEAEKHIRDAGMLCEAVGERLGGIEVTNLASVRRLLGRLDEALHLAGQGLADNRASGRTMEVPKSLGVLAQIHRDAGRLDQALDHARRAERLAREARNGFGLCLVTAILGSVHTAAGEYAEAAQVHAAVLDQARDAGMNFVIVKALLGLGQANLGLGSMDEAMPQVGRALAMARDAGYRIQEGNALTTMAEIHRALGDPARSARCAEQALAVHRETGFRLGEERARALCDVALR
ncbi:AfsR/SARP family transcriptional regulator [Nonomuraea mesophila]|uniref:AfsR/SARP family transcriptional regulator n=1 Tax=Nonomuraea mesophila TaxID=2530382 RepID=UPI001408273C|nr:BTAD domain-containing putative transcriptional regulator [Nonomuraea mesophila]